jgi:hypothetical protein
LPKNYDGALAAWLGAVTSHSPQEQKIDGSIQGDQIGRIFAHWVTSYFVQLYENYQRNQHFWAIVPTAEVMK